MQRTVRIIAILITLVSSLNTQAESRWNIYGGGSLSHYCQKPWVSSDKSYNWGGGAFLGGGYEMRFNSHWSLTPQLELSFVNNGATLSSKEFTFYQNRSEFRQTLSLNIPVIASFRFPVNDNIGLRFGAGPFLQEALAGWSFNSGSDKRESMSGTFANRFNVGLIGEAAVETGSHFSYFFRTQYPFLKEGWVKNTVTLSVGVGYSF